MTGDDRREIADLVHRYADAVCRHDAEQWASCWADDGHWSMGPDREQHGKEAIVESWLAIMARFPQVIQVVFNGAVEVDGDRATGRWYIGEDIQLGDGTARRSLAWYDDTYVRSEHGWQFAARLHQPLVSAASDLTADDFVTPPRG